MIPQIVGPAFIAWIGWVFLTPIPAAWALSQIPLAVVIAGLLLAGPPAVRPIRPFQLVHRPPGVVVIRRADAPTLAAWRARTAVPMHGRAA